MQKTEFSIILCGQYAPLNGTLTLQTDGVSVEGCFQFQDKISYFEGKLLRRNHYIATFDLTLAGQTQQCDALFVLQKNNVLTGALVDLWGCWTFTGTMVHQDKWLPVNQAVEKEAL